MSNPYEQFRQAIMGGLPIDNAVSFDQFQDARLSGLVNSLQPNPQLMNNMSNVSQQINQQQIDKNAKEQKRKERRQGLEDIATRFGIINAQQSGNYQQANVMQNNLLQRQQARKAEEEFARMYATLNDDQKRIVDLQRAGIKLPANNQTFERFGVYDLEGNLVNTVNKSDATQIQSIENNPDLIIGQLRSRTKQETEPLNIFSITDADGNRINQIANPTIEDINRLNENNLFINKPPQASDRGQGVPKFPGLNDLQGQFKATNKLVVNMSNLAKKFAETPESALALGNVTQFVDSIISNIDATGNMLKGEDYNSVLQQGYVSNGGKDYSSAIKTVSQATGITESRVRDLAYLFAAARGQEGRGLSDKDYENALRIVNGGVGAEGKIKVLEDVANRLTEEAYGDLNFIIGQLPPELDPARYNQLQGSIQPFVDPYNNQSAVPLNQADQILKDLGYD